VKLTLDIGNTHTKMVLWKDAQSPSEVRVLPTGKGIEIPDFVQAIGISNSSGFPDPVFSDFRGPVFSLNAQSKLPFNNGYATPETLGRDRLAAMAGAVHLFPNKNVMVLDAGTCLTTSVLENGVFLGGSISPGLTMRYRAMHEQTGRLPLLEAGIATAVIGDSTETSMRSGAWFGFLAEVEYRIRAVPSSYTCILTGGDAPVLAEHIKYPIFAAPLLNHYGLLFCLQINEL
jgi:type III pantothenate kinase